MVAEAALSGLTMIEDRAPLVPANTSCEQNVATPAKHCASSALAPVEMMAPLMLIEYQSAERLRPGTQCGVSTTPPDMCGGFFRSERSIAHRNAEIIHGQSAMRIDALAGCGGAGGIKFRQVGRANVVGPGGAQLDVVIDLAGQAQLPGFDQAAGRIAGEAARGVEIDRFNDELSFRIGASTSTNPSSTL